MTALLVMAALVVTAAEAVMADVADAQAIAQATGTARPAALDGRSMVAAAGASSRGAGAVSAAGMVGVGARVVSADVGRRAPVPCDDDGGLQPCNCPCHGPCPCALLHAPALPAAAGPATSSGTVAADTRAPGRADVAPRSPAREQALRPPIA